MNISLFCCKKFKLNIKNAMARTRNFRFTLNNWEPRHELLLESLPSVKYIVFGREIAPSTGTRHLQGFVQFDHGRTISAVRKQLAGAHVDTAEFPVEAAAYCKKDGDYIEIGTPPTSNESKGKEEKARWETAWKKAKEGNLEEIDADIRIRSYHTLKRIRQDFQPSVAHLETVCGLWIQGESGCGKTHAAFQSYPELFSKPRNIWWDGYQREPVVLLDDVDKYDVALGGKLKHWADKFSFIAEVKGGSMKIRPEKLIITSQYSIEEIWQDEETRLALNRRFVKIKKEKGQNIII